MLISSLFNELKSWTKCHGTNVHFWPFCTHTRRECNFTCLTSSPTTTYPVENCYLYYPEFQHCIGWGGGNSNAFLKGIASFIWTSAVKHRKLVTLHQYSRDFCIRVKKKIIIIIIKKTGEKNQYPWNLCAVKTALISCRFSTVLNVFR